MGKACCVPGCKSNYGNSKGPHVSAFKFPKDAKRQETWLQRIGRADPFQITDHTFVCIHHFDPAFVITEDVFKCRNGTVVKMPRERPTLTDNAYPSIFPNQPSYRSLAPAKKRRNPEDRQEQMKQAEKKRNFKAQEERDIIKDFAELKDNLRKRVSQLLFINCNKNYVTITKVCDHDFYYAPEFYTLRIKEDFSVKMFHNSHVVPPSKYTNFLGNEGKSDRWSKLEKLLDFLSNYDETLVEKISTFAGQVNKIVTIHEDDETEDSGLIMKIKFLSEQLKLAVMPVIRYSPKMLVWAATFFYTYPGAYKFARDTKILTLPHPKHLQKFLYKMGNGSPGVSPSQKTFLKESLKLLKDEDKIVTLMLDEIYVNSKVTYKGGQLYGLAQEVNNSTDITAGTILAFMAGSLTSKYENVIALFPVRNLTSNTLKNLTMTVMELMKEVGFTVLCLVSDNNRVNRNLFIELCGGVLKCSIPNPFDPMTPLFLMFDSVHRRLSGCNSHVSVEQVLESERKLKLLSVLKLKSSLSGDFSLSSFIEDCNVVATEIKEDLTFFEDAIYETDAINVTINDKRVLLCLSSYAATLLSANILKMI